MQLWQQCSLCNGASWNCWSVRYIAESCKISHLTDCQSRTKSPTAANLLFTCFFRRNIGLSTPHGKHTRTLKIINKVEIVSLATSLQNTTSRILNVDGSHTHNQSPIGRNMACKTAPIVFSSMPNFTLIIYGLCWARILVFDWNTACTVVIGMTKFRHRVAQKPLNGFRWNLEYITRSRAWLCISMWRCDNMVLWTNTRLVRSFAFLVHFFLYHTQWTAEGYVFGAVSLCFLFVCEISREPLDGFAPNSHGKRVGSLATMSLKIEVKGQSSRSPGDKNSIFSPKTRG